MRTVQRDLEALALAGIPVYATRGPEGGWELAGNFRTSLTGLTPAEAQALVIGPQPGVLNDIGLGRVGDAALVKVLAALPAATRDWAEHARQRVHVDLSPWGTPQDEQPHLISLQRAVWGDLCVEAVYGTAKRPATLSPLGLVAKGMVWYLVAARDGELRTYRVSRFHSVTTTTERFERPEHFDLPSYWASVSAGFSDALPNYPVTLLVRDVAQRRLGWAVRGIEWQSSRRRSWAEALVDLENFEEAVSLVLSLGPEAFVIQPTELRRAVAKAALGVSDLNATSVLPSVRSRGPGRS